MQTTVVVSVWILCRNGMILEGWVLPEVLRVLRQRNASQVPSQENFELIIDIKHKIAPDELLEVKDLFIKIA